MKQFGIGCVTAWQNPMIARKENGS